MPGDGFKFKPGSLQIPALIKPLRWRRMNTKDIEQVHQLEALLFLSPWSKNLFLQEVAEKDGTLPVVVLDGKMITGYLIAYFFLEEFHIANIGIAPAYQRKGIAFVMLDRLLRSAHRQGFVAAHLEVRKSNSHAIALYHKLGFEIVGLRKNYYEQEHEDALLMTCQLAKNLSAVNQT